MNLDAELREGLRRQCTPGAADELLVAEVVSCAAMSLRRVHDAQQRLAGALVPEVLADPKRAATVLKALQTAVDIGNALGRRIEVGLQAGLALKSAKVGTRR